MQSNLTTEDRERIAYIEGRPEAATLAEFDDIEKLADELDERVLELERERDELQRKVDALQCKVDDLEDWGDRVKRFLKERGVELPWELTR